MSTQEQLPSRASSHDVIGVGVAFTLAGLYFMLGAAGYLPVTLASYELTDKSGFYKQNPGTDVSVTQMIRKTTEKSRGVRLGNFVQIRTIVDEEMENVWSGKKAPKEGLDAAVQRGNEQLERFEKANKT